MRPINTEPFLKMMRITKKYIENGVLANDGIDLEVHRGEIHAIVGENGAGKTTIMRILYGLEHADRGDVFINGQKITIRNPLDAIKLGIGMVYQQTRLIHEFSVAANVVLGQEPLRMRIFLDVGRALRLVRDNAHVCGLDIDPKKKVSELTMSEVQQVEILRVLIRNPHLIILEEPTSVLTTQETKKLFTTLKQFRAMNKTVVLISHKLDEVKVIADHITVLRHGRVVAATDSSAIDKRELSRLMVGKDIVHSLKKSINHPGRVIFSLNNLFFRLRDGRSLIDNLNFTVRAGEIVGIVGLRGNGLEELEDIITGLRTPSSGRIYHDGTEITELSAVRLRKRGIAYVPADRLYRVPTDFILAFPYLLTVVAMIFYSIWSHYKNRM